MKRTSILTLVALFAATLTQQGGAWAQDTKDENWGQIKTATSEWTHLTSGSTTGFELKDEYYYVSEDLTFSNTMGNVVNPTGQYSGMYVQAGKTVHLYIPAGVTLTAIGADANSEIGAGAGILLPQNSTLYIHGEGTLVAKGGNAANGADGGNGTPGELDEESVGTWFLGKKIYCGVGGEGGFGGGGAGAGIGTAGGYGGLGGPTIGLEDDARPQSYADWEGGDLAGVPGQNGSAGSAAAAMGTLYIQPTITQQISGGAKGNGGAPGHWGNVSTTGGELTFEGFEVQVIAGIPIPIPQFDITDMQAVAGGGGGGGGAGGGHAENIGTGGSGGGGGASGACGSACAHNSWVNDNWGSVGAGGGTGGKGTDGNDGKDGYTCWFQGEDNIFDDMDNHKPGGIGGDAGAATVAVAAGAANAPQYTVNYYTIATTPSKTSENYNVGSSTKITLPSLSGGDKEYKWILSIYGNVAGKTSGHCDGPNTEVYSPGDQVDLSNIYGAIEFCAVYVGCDIDCASHINTYWGTAWASYVAGKYAVVSLKNRTLYKDGYWNTLTLPFSLSKEKLQRTCLAGADIRTYKSASWDGGSKHLTINFSESNDNEIKAGVPCLIRWGTPENAPGGTIEDPIFTNVQVDITDQSVLKDNNADNHYETVSNGLRLQAQIAPTQVAAGSRTFVLGAENKLYKPNDKMWVNATRAYFTYTKKSGIALAREFTIDFGDEQETTYIDNIMMEDEDGESSENTVQGIFNLAGQRLSAPQKGVNIINGKKVVI
ncbi:MAG: hypothetical protein IJV13_10085, partial [Prevotella sp.]|nr:hypothetical protein [Prevotella sp.]